MIHKIRKVVNVMRQAGNVLALVVPILIIAMMAGGPNPISATTISETSDTSVSTISLLLVEDSWYNARKGVFKFCLIAGMGFAFLSVGFGFSTLSTQFKNQIDPSKSFVSSRRFRAQFGLGILAFVFLIPPMFFLVYH